MIQSSHPLSPVDVAATAPEAEAAGGAEPTVALVRYGAIPEVARFRVPESLTLSRDMEVVVEAHHGLLVGRTLEVLQKNPEPHARKFEPPSHQVVRIATKEDLAAATENRFESVGEMDLWNDRIETWNIDLILIDIDRTLDRSKSILYVLNDRGPECTKLALQAAAAGLGVIDVQPVDADGIVAGPTESGGGGGGCGSCGCH